MSTAQIYESVIRVAQRECGGSDRDVPTLKHLDIGAGGGQLIQLMRARLPVESVACDFHIERFGLDGVPMSKVNLNREPLPYSDTAFDLVTCSEVVEHLENYRSLFREARRVLKPGGLLIISTPNVLNAYSRVRYLVSGFANLFGPLPVKNDKLYSTGGHITPIPYFYLAHSLLDADFSDVRLSIDKVQKTSVFWLVPLAPLIGVGWLRFLRLEERKYRTITPENRIHVLRHCSWPLLVGRTVIVSARKMIDR
ncbi:MAG: class I SAM-dependent methyltransferase [Gammaproteobacteria bacterium]|nr:class I SAM-dependent methyltransferase [Gammaproteobacteria bacterium]